MGRVEKMVRVCVVWSTERLSTQDQQETKKEEEPGARGRCGRTGRAPNEKKRRARLARSPARVAKAANAASCDYTGRLPAHIHVRVCGVSGSYANTKREEATLGTEERGSL